MTDGGTKMMGANYGRREDDNGFNISMVPKWLTITMIVCKGFLLLTPFTISSIMLVAENTSLIWNCVWCLSLLRIIDFANE